MSRAPSSNSSQLHDYVALLARIVVGVVLFYAGYSKATSPPAEFASAIDAYQILPVSWVAAAAVTLPWIEIYTGVFVVSGFFIRPSACVSTLLFAIFLTVLGLSYLRGIDPASCGCFGAGINIPVPLIFTLDAISLAASFYLLMKPSEFFSVDDWIGRGD